MDRIINSHVDKIENIHNKLYDVIDEQTDKMAIEEVISNPEIALTMVVDNIKQEFLKEYAGQAVELGIDFGKLVANKIEQDKTLKIDDSENPKLNDKDGN